MSLLYSFVVYLYINGSGSITSVGEERANLLLLLLFTCNYVVSVWRGCLFFWVLGMGYVFNCGTPRAFHIIILQACQHKQN